MHKYELRLAIALAECAFGERCSRLKLLRRPRIKELNELCLELALLHNSKCFPREKLKKLLEARADVLINYVKVSKAKPIAQFIKEKHEDPNWAIASYIDYISDPSIFFSCLAKLVKTLSDSIYYMTNAKSNY